MTPTRLVTALQCLTLMCLVSACSTEPVIPAATPPAPPALRTLDDVIQSSNSFQITHVTLFDGGTAARLGHGRGQGRTDRGSLFRTQGELRLCRFALDRWRGGSS